jgi:nitrite reductase/ring-hydroxylating ferredoxin subunit
MAEGGWTAVGLSRDLEPGAVAGVIIEGREWALWRSESGRAHLWEDRCPHRGMRLSFGFVRGDRIGCLYHGWQYDEAGQCRFIPAHPELDVPATIRVPAYEIAESGAMLWATFAAATSPPPTFSAALPVRSLYLDAALSDALKVLSEMAANAADTPGAAQAKIVENEGDTLLIAGQGVDERRSCLHIALVDPPAGEPHARQKHHAQWAERLRRAAEARR